MKIYADTSFLVSLLYGADTGHSEARRTFNRYATDDWLTSEWSRFETVNSLRQLCRRGWDATRAEATVRLFKHWHRFGPFERTQPSLDEAMAECQILSAAHAASMTMRGADLLHVALLDQLAPDLFLTRDQQQFALAQTAGIPSLLVP